MIVDFNLCRLLATSIFTLLLLGAPVVGLDATTVDMTLLHDIQADLAQQAGLDGKGVIIGVVSGGINGYQAAQAAGALPASIDIIGNQLGTGGEGTAMLEVVHQIAPQATLAFCSNIINAAIPVSYCAQQLVQNFGAQIVVDDLGFSTRYTYAPFPDSYNYDQLLAQKPSLIAIHSGGNQQEQSFVGPFIPVTLNIAGTTYQVEDFGKAAGLASTPYESVTIPPGQYVNLLMLSNQNPNSPAPSSNDVMAAWVLGQFGEVLYTLQWNKYSLPLFYQNNGSVPITVHIVVGLITQNNPDPIAITLNDLSGNILPINGTGGAGEELGPSAGVWSIAAVNEQSLTIESLSDTGPATVYFSATQIGSQNGAPLLSYSPLPEPLVLNHPDLAGADCVTIYPVSGFNDGNTKFCGTSAAAPTVAGVVALMLQAGYGKIQILQSLEATAKPVPAAGQTSTGQSPDSWDPNDGYGLVQVWAALQNAGLLVPEPTITNPASFSVIINAGQNVSFAGICAPPSGQTVTGYEWEFQGTNAPAATTQQNPTITFQNPGSYTAAFTCTDSQSITNPNPATAIISVKGTGSGGGAPPPSSGGSHGGGGGAEGFLAIGLFMSMLILRVVMKLKYSFHKESV